jgi:DNA-binding LacI/PurR family transcriptional regulator
VPTVRLGGGDAVPAKTIYCVQPDDASIGRMAAEHFLQRGLRSFAYCGTDHVFSIGRQTAYEQTLADAGRTCREIVYSPPEDHVAGSTCRHV